MDYYEDTLDEYAKCLEAGDLRESGFGCWLDHGDPLAEVAQKIHDSVQLLDPPECEPISGFPICVYAMRDRSNKHFIPIRGTKNVTITGLYDVNLYLSNTILTATNITGKVRL
ncbi:hypothetical protein [Tropicibacter naphthalenivorans]|uniref:Uncharacterized protein n=1 Tax=Tropicibacter naphthalenivorans TaxID=441103 RepID=A0A0P1G209_9RHOB|nr:hypothetical protein [Tropicibacter naphthalenivorans]CUH75858.1 hypothetical protein TRN7648_00659 [Tropicibacter naphthalenivorans]SMC41810.1 hypothetical protein SAMN04488093_101225 [Tropicibacter naphthalenivorans]